MERSFNSDKWSILSHLPVYDAVVTWQSVTLAADLQVRCGIQVVTLARTTGLLIDGC